MEQPKAYYNGEDITCYPSSNAKDDGKLNLEFNMARLVTRVTSKNFCIVKPSFELKIITNTETGKPQIQVGKGQASINGMDIIASNTLTIDPPSQTGEYYLAFKLWRNDNGNVLGDFIQGVTNTFEGVSLTWYDTKDTTNPDIFYLCSVNWDGTTFNDLKDDEDKYGRIWAEDILAKINDPKHPTITRLILQDWIDKVPDWYVSKEGDIMYGALELTDGRKGSGKTGIKIQANSSTNSSIIVKAPSVDSKDENRVCTIQSTDTGTSVKLGKSSIYTNSTDNYCLNINSGNNTNVHSDKELHLQGDKGTFIGSGGNGDTPQLKLLNHVATFSDGNSTTLKYNIDFSEAGKVKQTIGKAIWQYTESTKDITLLQDNVRYLDIYPNSIFRGNSRVVGTLSLGASDSLPQTTLSRTSWVLSENVNNGSKTQFTPNTINVISGSTKSDGYINVTNNTNTTRTKLFDTARIELVNASVKPTIFFSDTTNTYDIQIEKILNKKALNITGELDVTNLVSSGSISGKGLITTNGELTFINGENNATITKGNGSNALKTSGPLYVGATGNQALNTGNTTINGTLSVGSSKQFTVSTNGDVNTSGSIRASKVYNAVYNGFGEIFRKDKNEVIEYGDIVCIREDGLAHKVCSEEDLNTIIGICSNTIGVQMGGKDIPEEEQLEVEMLGQIWVKTKDKNIVPGQIVKADTDGTVSITTNRNKRFGITLTNVIDGKVRIVYNG